MPLPYLQLDFTSLYVQSMDLKKRFNRLAGFFHLHSKKKDQEPMSWLEFQEEVKSLQNKYDAAAAKIEELQGTAESTFRFFGQQLVNWGLSRTDRKGQIAAITDLIPLINEAKVLVSGAKKKDPEEEDQVRKHILLGPLLYRYIRFITKDYKSLEEALAKSALCNAIHQILELSPENEFNESKNNLDEWTIMKSCQLFYDFMKKSNKAARIPYIQDHPDFLENLQEIITRATTKAQPFIRQLAYIDFIQSVAETLMDFKSKLFPVLDQIVEKKTEQEFDSPKAILTYLLKIDGLLAYQSTYLKLVIGNDSTKFSAEDPRPDVPKSLREAIVQIKQLIERRNEYTLMGAYLAVLMRCTSGSWPNKEVRPDKKLLHDLLLSVIATKTTRQLDYKTRDIDLECLHDFLGLPEITNAIDIKCWGQVVDFQTAIEQEMQAIAPFLTRESAQREIEAKREREREMVLREAEIKRERERERVAREAEACELKDERKYSIPAPPSAITLISPEENAQNEAEEDGEEEEFFLAPEL